MKKESQQEKLLNNYANLDLEILPPNLRKKGFDYRLVERTNAACIYEQSTGGHDVADEVFKTKIEIYRDAMIKMKERTGRGNNPENLKEFREVFPLDEEFGTRAWTYCDLEKAKMAFKRLVKESGNGSQQDESD